MTQYGVDRPLPSVLNDPPLPIFLSEEALLLSGVTLSRVISVVSPLAAMKCLFVIFPNQVQGVVKRSRAVALEEDHRYAQQRDRF